MLIDELSKIITENNIPVFRLAVYENGEECEREFLIANDCNNIYSVSKSFTAAAVGILFERGLLTPDTKLSSIFKDAWEGVTVKHLLTHTAGHMGMLLDMDCDDIFSYGTDDFLKKVLSPPLTFRAGEHFAYSDSNYYLLSRVVAEVTGETLQQFCAREIFTPLCIQGHAWSTCPQGHAMGGTRLFIRTLDMLHFGRMLSEGGVYNGRRILSKAFIDEAAKPHACKNDSTFYGYGLWLRKNSSAFCCSGMLGQKIFVDRKNRRVVAWQAYDTEHKTDMLVDYLYGK